MVQRDELMFQLGLGAGIASQAEETHLEKTEEDEQIDEHSKRRSEQKVIGCRSRTEKG